MGGLAAAGGRWAVAPVLSWLFRKGRFLADPNELTQALALRLSEAGAPLVRLRLSLRADGPRLDGWSAVWTRGRPLDRDRVAQAGLCRSPAYIGSPLEHLDRTGTAFRLRLEPAVATAAHPLLHRLAAQGATDYLALPMPFTDGRMASLAAVTDRCGGFVADDIGKLEALAEALSPVLEAAVARHLARIQGQA
jgi:adenylate cyclase